MPAWTCSARRPGGTISAASLQLMHQTIYQILRDAGRRPGEVVSLEQAPSR